MYSLRAWCTSSISKQAQCAVRAAMYSLPAAAVAELGSTRAAASWLPPSSGLARAAAEGLSQVPDLLHVGSLVPLHHGPARALHPEGVLHGGRARGGQAGRASGNNDL